MVVNYLLTERDFPSDAIAVIKDINTDRLNENFYPELVNKVGQAIEDEFCYDERVKVIHDETSLKSVSFPYENNTTILYMNFKCTDNDGEEEIRELVLVQIAIY